MLIRLLGSLEFRSGNDLHRPVLDALAIVKKYASSRLQVYPSEERVPVTEIVRGSFICTFGFLQARAKSREGLHRNSVRFSMSAPTIMFPRSAKRWDSLLLTLSTSVI